MTNHKCLCCNKERPDGSPFDLCKNCCDKFVAITGDVCDKCGEMVISGNKICDRCKRTEYYFDKNISFAVYNEVSAKIVKKLKYNGVRFLAREISKMLTQKISEDDEFDFVTFVPLSKNRFAERGFNQAELIAKYFAKINNFKIYDVLNKCENEIHQAGLSAKERMKNISGTFSVKDSAKEIVKGKSVLIVDDVFTTGATLSECAKTLKKAGAIKIFTITFAKTELGKF